MHRRTVLLSALAGMAARPAWAQFQPNMEILPAWKTAWLEHQDRRLRLLRLADIKGIDRPDITEEVVSQYEHRLGNYPTDLPVLRVVFRDRVLFDFNQAKVRPEAGQILDMIAASLRLEPPDVTVFIAGHTDAVGSVEYNLDLGLRRARAAAVSLVQEGVHQAQVFMVSFGKAVPVASNDTDEGRARNRRVEFLFSARPEPVAAWLVKQQVQTCTANRSDGGDNCPQIFKAESVSISTLPTTRDVGSKGKTVSPDNKGKTVRPEDRPKKIRLNEHSGTAGGGEQIRSVDIGRKVVELDLRHKIFTIKAPE
jgi:outer membrane protein OmpA-like peptidoglycan-associated protein